MDKCFVRTGEKGYVNLLLASRIVDQGEDLKIYLPNFSVTVAPDYRDRVLAALDSLTDDGVRGPRR